MNTPDAYSSPESFKPCRITLGGPFVDFVGPLSIRDDGETATMGLRIERRHCGLAGVCHGGVLATFADVLIAVTAFNAPGEITLRRAIPTVNLQIDYLAPVRLGDFIEGTAQVLKTTRSLVFGQGLVRVANEVVLRCSGVYKLGGDLPDDWLGIFERLSASEESI